MISRDRAIQLATERLVRERVRRDIGPVTKDDFYGGWQVCTSTLSDPFDLGDPVLVVTAGGDVHILGSEPYAIHYLMRQLGIPPLNDTIDAWEREGGAEGLALLADRRYAEALAREGEDPEVHRHATKLILGEDGYGELSERIRRNRELLRRHPKPN